MIRAPLAAAALVLGLAPVAHADPPVTSTETSSTEAGVVDAGWMRVVCTGTALDQRCHIRVPAGFTHMATTYIHGGEAVGTEETMPYSYRPRLSGERFSRHVTTGIHVACRIKVRSRVTCKVRVAEHVDRFAFTTWSAGDNYGTVIWTRA